MTLSIFSPDWRNDLVRWITSSFGALDSQYVNVSGDTMTGNLKIAQPTLSNAVFTAANTSFACAFFVGAGGNTNIYYDSTKGVNFASETSADIAAGTLSGTVRLSIDSVGNISQFGGQLAFPATQNPSSNANILDDYEESTWTPGVAFGGGSTGATYGARTGRYVKIGQLVIASFDLTLTAKGSSTGQGSITGLPFTSLNDVIGLGVINFTSGMSGLTGAVKGFVSTNATSVVLVQDGATGSISVSDANFTNTSRVLGTAIYRAT